MAAQTPATRIATAVLPLPADLRAGATVLALRADGLRDTLRVGSNPMVCVADMPGDTLIDVRCYHTAFLPLMQRAGKLLRAGQSDSAVNAELAAALRSGGLKLPAFPTAGYRIRGPLSGYDPAGPSIDSTVDRWQSVHMPFVTAKALGIDTLERGTDPYMMSSGTWWAHIMIMQRPLRY